MDAIFSVYTMNQSSPVMELGSGIIQFDAVDIHVEGSKLELVYNAVVALFHATIVRDINTAMALALTDDMPKTVNSYLSDVPEEVCSEAFLAEISITAGPLVIESLWAK